ncbi:hypothetical protein DEO72_LG11g2076 [Vigna unguiculata]|uniref:Uncharacterized protein n=1 Tax=Vigna unguiculata TaxID=3917 RepID=A0A4D6NP12_VIGUN|nr:hypothetical protein DEO72_LG11g2076 [Vigna unguiculata]
MFACQSPVLTPFQGEIVARSDTLAQASLSCLGETYRNRREGSPKRACEGFLAPLSRSRLSKSLPPKRGHSSRLSEGS